MHPLPNKETVSVLFISAPEPVRLVKRIRETVLRHGGVERASLAGDQRRLFSFSDPGSALQAAVEIRTGLGDTFRIPPIIALTVGKVSLFGELLFGVPVSVAEILLSSGHPGQLLASEPFKQAVQGIDSSGWTASDLGDHRFRELPKRLRIWQFSPKGERTEFAPLKSLSDGPNNLPNDSTSFVGRTSDVEAIEDYLTFSRVVTLLGAAGAGKTRLAIQSGHELVRQFRDGVFLVRLVDSEEGVHVPSLMAQALKVDPKDLEAHLDKKQFLFILDNCEHVVEDVYATVRHYLDTQDEVCFLLTSRQPIIPGIEQEHYVEPLSLPEQALTAAAALRGEAVRLFLERLLLYRPNFALTEANALMIARICARLEGLPLAIELAAARARLLSLEEVYEALDDELQLLRRTGDRIENLHSTMTGTIEWSFRLLDYHEARLLSRLSAFSGGFTAASAQAVCDFGDIPSVSSALDQLIAKSLIFPIESPTYESRFRMLEPIRQFAGSLLEDQDAVLERMLTWCLDWTAVADTEIIGPNVSTALRMIDADLPNVRIAFHYALEHCPNQALDLVLVLHRYWMRGSHHEEGRRWAQRCLEFVEPELAKKAQAYNLIGSSSFLSNDTETALTYLQQSLAMYGELNLSERVAVVSCNMAMVEVDLGDRKSAERHFQQSIEFFRMGESPLRLLNGLGNLANFYRDEEPEISLQYLREALELARAIGDRFQECHCLAMASTVQAETGRFEEARESLLAFLRMHDYPDPKRTLMALEAATRLALEEEDPRRARRWLLLCDRLRHETGILPGARVDRIEALRGRIQGAGFAVVSQRTDTAPPQLKRTLSQVAKWLAKTAVVAVRAD